jgi:hypothetical protein
MSISNDTFALAIATLIALSMAELAERKSAANSSWNPQMELFGLRDEISCPVVEKRNRSDIPRDSTSSDSV